MQMLVCLSIKAIDKNNPINRGVNFHERLERMVTLG